MGGGGGGIFNLMRHLLQYVGGSWRCLERYLALQTLQNSCGSVGMWMVVS